MHAGTVVVVEKYYTLSRYTSTRIDMIQSLYSKETVFSFTDTDLYLHTCMRSLLSLWSQTQNSCLMDQDWIYNIDSTYLNTRNSKQMNSVIHSEGMKSKCQGVNVH